MNNSSKIENKLIQLGLKSKHEVSTIKEVERLEESITIVNFYGLSQEHFDFINCYTDRTPNELIPIAECPGGNQLCIGINNNSLNKIYYWDHNKEKMQISTIEDMWEPVTLIYDSFFDFIMSSEELKEDEDLGDTRIENIKVSDKFLSRFKKNT